MSELDRLRREQSDAVMPLLGGLLDQWEGMSNDSKSALRWENPTFCEYLDKVNAAMEGGSPADPVQSSTCLRYVNGDAEMVCKCVNGKYPEVVDMERCPPTCKAVAADGNKT